MRRCLASDRHFRSFQDGPVIIGADMERGLEQDAVADGLFDALAWLFVMLGTPTPFACGISIAPRRRGGSTPAWLLVGWCAFNVVEGDHSSRTGHPSRS
jgi:hypothetical protein